MRVNYLAPVRGARRARGVIRRRHLRLERSGTVTCGDCEVTCGDGEGMLLEVASGGMLRYAAGDGEAARTVTVATANNYLHKTSND